MFDKSGMDWGYWFAVVGAVVIKMTTSPYHSFLRAVFTGFAAVFSAIVFTDPIIYYLGVSTPTYGYAIAALVTLTGEGMMRFVIGLSNDPKAVLGLWAKFRGLK